MQQRTFPELGVATSVMGDGQAPEHRDTHPRASHGHPRRHRRAGRPGQGTHRVRQDPGVRPPHRGAPRPAGPPARGPGAGPHAGAGRPGGGGAGRRRPHARPADGGRLRGGVDRRTVESRGPGTHPHRHARPAGRPGPPQAGPSGPHPDPHPRRGRPDAGHGIPATGERHREAAPHRATDDVLLGDARRRRREDRPGLHEGRAQARGAHRHPHRGGGLPQVHQGGIRREGRRPGEAAHRGARGEASCSSGPSAAPTVSPRS